MESFKSVASTSPRRTRTCWESEPENELNEDKDKLKQELNKDGGVSDAHSFHQDGCQADVGLFLTCPFLHVSMFCLIILFILACSSKPATVSTSLFIELYLSILATWITYLFGPTRLPLVWRQVCLAVQRTAPHWV